MPKLKKSNQLHTMLTNPELPLDHRLELLKGLVNNNGAENKVILASLLDGAGPDPEDLHAQKINDLNALIREMMEGPLRNAVFIGICEANGSPVRQALVVLDDGTQVYTAVPDAMLAGSLRTGDRVILEGKGRALLKRAETFKVGEVVNLERWVDERHIEVKGRGDERAVLLASAILMDKARTEHATPGMSVIVNPKQGMAFDVLPSPDGLAHYRYLAKVPVPDVVVERDIGAPPRCIEELSSLIRAELVNPDVRRRYNLPRCVMKLLAGVSGSGKTLALQAIWRRMYEIMSEVTGVLMDQLPPRVFRLRMSEVLSKWLGDSDKKLDRFFTEVEQLADEPFVGPDGRTWRLPVLAIMEEIDGLARARGHDPIYDRILTTALQRLDSTREDLRARFIIFIGTTNEPQSVDRAFLRRIGGTVEQFSRLNRKAAFVAVLQKHIHRLPLFSNNGHLPVELQRKMISDVTGWLFSPNGSDRGVVELTYAGSTTPQVRYRRDFLTGALIDRAVRQAAEETCKAETLEGGAPGLKFETLVRAFDEQIRSVIEQLTEHNAREYTDVPDGVRVASVRRVAQPAIAPTELQRA
jgi:ATP-dependent 26S proteasome regulatory subunit